jgi:hypothetical protein
MGPTLFPDRGLTAENAESAEKKTEETRGEDDENKEKTRDGKTHRETNQFTIPSSKSFSVFLSAVSAFSAVKSPPGYSDKRRGSWIIGIR